MRSRTNTEDVGNIAGELMSVVVVFLLMVVVFLVVTAKVGGAMESMLKAQLEFMSHQNANNAVAAAGAKADAEAAKEDADKAREAAKISDENATNAEREAQDAKDATDREKNKADQYRRELDDAKASIKASQNIQVVIVIDGSASVAATLPDMIKTTVNVVNAMPEAMDSFAIGFVISQDENVEVHGVQKVEPTKNSTQRIVKTVTDIKPVGAHIDFPKGLKAGMDELDRVADGSRQLLVIFGDVAEELPNRNAFTSNANSVSLMKRWANSGKTDRRVLALHTGNEDVHRRVFEQLGAVNANSSLGITPSDLFFLIIQTAFKG